ncbi:hypothetical protein NFI96_007135 [Prochilodus magdalenae]|nr:hypothetical protein NFI96_007135 [Prochilodus magdalenae]
MFFDFSSAFNTIQPLQLRDKLARMQVDPHLVSWITDYLTGRPQYVRLKDCTSETVVSSTGAPQGTVLSPFLFTLYTSEFRYNSETCHMQIFSHDTAIVACVRGGQEAEYRNLVEDFVAWCQRNNLLLNTSKTKEMVVDFRRARPLIQPVFIEGVEVEMVRTYRYLGLHLDERLDWSANTDVLYRKGQSRLYFLRRLESFNICRKLLQMFYQTVVSSCLFYAVVCWGGSIKKRDEMRLDKLVRRAGSVVGVELDSVVKAAERRTLHKLLSIMDDDGHPLHTIIMDRRSKFSGRLLSQSCSTDRLRRSFVKSAPAPVPNQVLHQSRDGQDGEYRDLVNSFVEWSFRNHLLLNVTKTKEMVVDFRRKRSTISPITIMGQNAEVVDTYKYLGVLIDHKLD